MRQFQSFICVDWSGAKGEFLPGIAVAQAHGRGRGRGQGDDAPTLIDPLRKWSRGGILQWLRGIADAQCDVLIGLDLSLGFPFADHGCYFPQWPGSPRHAKDLWQWVDSHATNDPHLGAQSFLGHEQGRRHFRHAKGDVGDLFEGGVGRLRVVESHQRATRQANSWSCFNLVGAGQVGKSSLTGMRMLHQLGGRIPVWPFDPVPASGPVIIEIYTSMAARAAGLAANRSKIRTAPELSAALNALGSAIPDTHPYRMDDHATDALLTAAWMRIAASNMALWQPKMLNNKIRQTEGWTFGVV